MAISGWMGWENVVNLQKRTLCYYWEKNWEDIFSKMAGTENHDVKENKSDSEMQISSFSYMRN